ncbi:LacI family transcriptional regulator, partial [Stenotrophomonas maltophilia]
TDHLLRQGHTRIGFIRGRDDLSASALRYDGFVTNRRPP